MPRSILPAILTMLTVLPLLLLCCGLGIGIVHCSTVHENSEDFHSLMDFKKGITNDPSGALSNWTSNTHFCRWNGVKCTLTRPYHVRWLTFPHQNLAGQISPSLGNLTNLTVLDLSSNNLHGLIPPLNKLQNLEYLLLERNSLQGVIPNALTNCSNLLYVDLSGNNLMGGIPPPRMGFLPKLEVFLLYRNNISGVIPPGLGNITNLSEIDVSENQLNGPIPDEFWQMTNLAYLSLYENNLSGGIPQTLSNLSSLQQLSLSYNQLGNTLPSNFGNAIPNLQSLYLSNNMFEGQIPDSLGNASALVNLSLSYNQFTGQIPSIFGKFSLLSHLYLEGNMLEASGSGGWEFIDSLTNCSSLNVLSLASNNLQGDLPK